MMNETTRTEAYNCDIMMLLEVYHHLFTIDKVTAVGYSSYDEGSLSFLLQRGLVEIRECELTRLGVGDEWSQVISVTVVGEALIEEFKAAVNGACPQESNEGPDQ